MLYFTRHYLLLCVVLLVSQVNPLEDPIPSSSHYKHATYEESLRSPPPHRLNQRSPPSNPPASTPQPPVPSIPPLNTLSLDDLPSSSGAFTPVNFPPGWICYPISSSVAVRPVQVTAASLIRFYEYLIQACAHHFWAPQTNLLNAAIQWGAFTLTVDGAKGSPPLQWGILALLAQGMLERAR
ncbi:MAG: hypothetical protein Q9174_006053, partial [Haloplaca sp. 1 TL-2023]